MKFIKLSIILVVFSSSSIVKGQHTLTLEIEGITSDEGKVSVAFYTNQATFLKFDKVFKTGSENAVKGTTTLKIKDIPDGTYAVAVFHDKNGNEKLDTNMFGIPKEPIAFSKAKMKTFGPPKFEECAFKVTSDFTLAIKME